MANYSLQSVDILSNDFKERDFDIIYAQGVIHHFNPISVILPVLQDILKEDGKIITFDPLQTQFLTRTVRMIYHPFRIDKDWEWPFKKQTFSEIRRYFNIAQIQGVMGLAKWAIPVVFINKPKAIDLAIKLHRKDLGEARAENAALWGCMQVAMCWEKKKP